jgi:hypothetical protein
MDDITGPVAKRNGTVMLKPRDKTSENLSQKIYKVQRHGQIRLSNGGSTNYSVQVTISASPQRSISVFHLH